MSTPTPLPPAIVLVDDEPDVRIILHRVLMAVADGYDLIAVGTGAAALKALEQRFAPLLITDYNMPGMNGLELAQAVKAASPTTTVVLITAYGTRDLASRSRAAGVDYYLPKPFPFDDLEAIVRSALV
jgi:two-component system, response regulator, stage 0 sporulation protein F